MKKIFNGNSSVTEKDEELSLRPTKLDEYIGQEELKTNLKIFIGAALYREECLDHILLFGPPGLGKTTLAHVIANEMHSNIRVVNGPSIEKIGDLASILSNLEPGDVLFIDEIHRIPRAVEEVLYSAMEDFKLNVIINRDSGPKAINLDLPPFTLIGATTRVGNLSLPLRTRFGIKEKINFYLVEELASIIKRSAKVFLMEIDDKACLEIAKRSRGTPRIANRLLKRIRDFANYEKRDYISIKDTNKALSALKIDKIGLDEVDIKYLDTLINRFNGGPVGLETLASTIGEEITNLEDVCEPFLLQIGFIDRTPRGRVASKKAYSHLNIPLRNK